MGGPPGSGSPRDAELADLLELHASVDARADALASSHAARLRCRRGCSDCCVDDLTVFEVEAERIRRNHAALLADGEPGPPGACAFLDGEGACRIHPDRPYVCRTQGLPLRWLFETPGGAIEEGRDICPKNSEGPDLATLEEDDLWLIGPWEDRLARLQEASGDGGARRVALRSLFARSR
jgi:hypothetical protein